MNPYHKHLFFSFIFILLGVGISAQEWDVKVEYLTQSDKLHVEVTPNYEYNLYYTVFFPPSVLNQNIKDSIIVYGRTKTPSFVESPFELGPNNSKFSYIIDLKKVTNVPTSAYLNYGDIQIANWEEILFDSDKGLTLHIEFVKEKKVYDLGTQSLSAWKSNPSKIIPTKLFMALNNIKITTSIGNDEVGKMLEETLADFKYFIRPTELILLFAAEGLPSGGVFYDDLAIVYVDSKTSGEDPEFNMKKTILHELYHGVSPYEIYPEADARDIGQNWLSEATPEYLSIKYMLQHKMIKDKEFLEIMERKMRIGTRFNGLSLELMSSEVYRNSEYYQAFYSKGCVAFWLLDMKLFEMTDGTVKAIDLINGVYTNLDEQTQLQISNVMHDMEQELVFNVGPFPMNKYLSSFGLLYEKQIVLPYRKKSETAQVRRENITFNKLANGEQKSLWKRFISE